MNQKTEKSKTITNKTPVNQPAVNKSATAKDEQQTKILPVDKSVRRLESHPSIQEAASMLRNGEVVAFPTETVYGLGADALSDAAINKIYLAKGRPADNPLIVHLSDRDQISEYVTSVSEKARRLMKAFWPGPLTLVLEHSGKLSAQVTANLSTVAVRIPDHPVALALITAANRPIAAPSANTSGRPSPTAAAHVYDDLKGRIPAIVDGGVTGVGVESTVVDCTADQVMILRPGGITKEAIEAVVGEVTIDPALAQRTGTATSVAPKSPGMKYTHYAPDAPLVLIDGGVAFFQDQVTKAMNTGKKTGVLVSAELDDYIQADKKVIVGSRENLSTVAGALYESLRAFKANEVDIIFSEVFPETELGVAIMNRLYKAAGNQMISEQK
ncbi:L-threonylcarbamoyladenylate synthase [Evansella caseinilytica]|uniref:Threonylcarbamoyl-AMP synthase n=1 Tax=Evansella caseinilytica TaxID=1503961 RepID=A0A1H3T5D9_9BACI|nr:L-threonylcarbamoyladenylate synthase [Evansella caseinilytica]SDZ45452.1 L-threonylcarbamoyladenylate synthase [Evansella caseinilytica]